MMTRSRFYWQSTGLASLFVAALFAAGCSSGDGAADSPDVTDGNDPVGGIDGGGRRVYAVGPINGFGSVIVNGVRYDTSTATIAADGTAVDESALKPGQIVRILATGAAGSEVAETVAFDDNVEGPIGAVDLAGGRLTVLGQSVLVSSATAIDDGADGDTLDALSVGDVVEVSGYLGGGGQTVATRIDRSGSTDFEVFGRAADVDTAGFTFRINDLTVDYSQASLEGFTAGNVTGGDLVEVRGSTTAAADSLTASRVIRFETVGELDLDDADVDIEGLVTDFVSATEFAVSGIPVTTDAATTYEDGVAADLGLDVLLEISGRFDPNGRLLADSIEFEDDGFVEIEAAVESVDVAAGEVVLLGITVRIEDDTRFEDDDSGLRSFGIDDLAVGDWLEITGVQADPASNVVLARTLERDDPEDEVSLQGIAGDLADPGFSILGVPIITDGNTEFDDTDRATFFSEADGQIVEVEGSWDGTRILADEVELEDDSADD